MHQAQHHTVKILSSLCKAGMGYGGILHEHDHDPDQPQLHQHAPAGQEPRDQQQAQRQTKPILGYIITKQRILVRY